MHCIAEMTYEMKEVKEGKNLAVIKKIGMLYGKTMGLTEIHAAIDEKDTKIQHTSQIHAINYD